MMGATLYLVGRDGKTDELLTDTDSCSMCKRLIINSGITTVIIRTGKTEYKVTSVRDWVYNDDSISNIKL